MLWYGGHHSSVELHTSVHESCRCSDQWETMHGEHAAFDVRQHFFRLIVGLHYCGIDIPSIWPRSTCELESEFMSVLWFIAVYFSLSLSPTHEDRNNLQGVGFSLSIHFDGIYRLHIFFL